MAKFKLDRRTVLRAAGQAAITLPFLEIMTEGKASAAAPAPRRFVVMSTGVSLGRNQQVTPFWRPAAEGSGYPLDRDLAPLGKTNPHNPKFGAYDVQDQVSVVSGLKVPWVDREPVGPAGWLATGKALFHGHTVMIPLLTGLPVRVSGGYTGPTADQIVANDPGFSPAPAFRSLQIGVQPVNYLGGSRQNLAHGPAGRAMTSQADPHAMWNTIFPLVKGASQGDNTAAIAKEKSILDHWVARTNRIKSRLGKADEDRMETFFGQVRDVESRLALIAQARGPACQPPAEPPAFRVGQPITDNQDPAQLNRGGYSDEVKRAEVMRDLLFLALACDLTRVATFDITWAQSAVNTIDITGRRDLNVHSCSHYPASTQEYQDLLAWHAAQLGYVVSKLKAADDPDGNKMIDNTVLVMLTEGGLGFSPTDAMDPNANKPQNSPHSSENLTLLVAGGGNLGLRPGRHIFKNNTAHPASVMLSAMKAVGSIQPLGDIKTGLPELKT